MRYLIVSIYCSLLSLTFAADKVSLDSFVASYGFPSPTRTEGKLLVRSRYTEMAFTSDSRMMRYNGMLIWMNAGAYAGRREWNITKADAEKVLAPLLRARDFASKQGKPKLVLIDPGHGGSQTGAKPRTGGLYEKKLALDIAIRLRDRLAKKGIKCALTRDRDRTLSLAGRSRKVGQLGADLFVSIHLNSAGNTLPQDHHHSTP
jgi:N-acetylmuramoyl-L-alanine amidase